MVSPVSSPKFSSSSRANVEVQALAVAPEHKDSWAVFQRSFQVEIAQLDAEYEPLLKQEKQEERKALSNEIKEAIKKGANIEFSLEEADEKAVEKIAAYKSKFLAIAEACFKEAMNRSTSDQTTSLDLQLRDGLSHQLVELSERMAEMEITHDQEKKALIEKVKIFNEKINPLEAELRSLRLPAINSGDTNSEDSIDPEELIRAFMSVNEKLGQIDDKQRGILKRYRRIVYDLKHSLEIATHEKSEITRQLAQIQHYHS